MIEVLVHNYCPKAPLNHKEAFPLTLQDLQASFNNIRVVFFQRGGKN